MFRMKKWFFCGLCLLLMSVPTLSGAQENKTSIDPQADNILRQMSAYLGGLQQFTFHVENSVDTLRPCNQKLQLLRAVDMFVKRPNRLRANIDGDRVSQELYYDGKSITRDSDQGLGQGSSGRDRPASNPGQRGRSPSSHETKNPTSVDNRHPNVHVASRLHDGKVHRNDLLCYRRGVL
jgi:hypothetical protein